MGSPPFSAIAVNDAITRMTKTGRYAILEQFVADGVSHIFGNPGTVEQGFLDALGDFLENNNQLLK